MKNLLLFALVGAGATLRADAAEVNQGLGNLLIAGGVLALVKDMSGSTSNV